MNELIPTLQLLLDPLAAAFRQEVHALFCKVVAAWIVCLGRRTISRVWETTGQTEQRNHAAIFRRFSEAAWNWDEVGRLLLLQVLALVPGIRLWVVVDDTLAHKRGTKVAFGGIFLDAVLSTKKHKVFRFGNNWVMLGVVVELPFRTNRYFCLSILWRVYEKQGSKTKQEHRTKSQLAAEMVAVLAGWLPQRKILVVGDSAYIGKHLLLERPANVDALGPIHWKAALYEAWAEPQGRKKHGRRLPNPKAMLANQQRWPSRKETIKFKDGIERELAIKVITGVCWYATAGPQAVQVVLVHDPLGKWRDEALVCTDVTLNQLLGARGLTPRHFPHRLTDEEQPSHDSPIFRALPDGDMMFEDGEDVFAAVYLPDQQHAGGSKLTRKAGEYARSLRRERGRNEQADDEEGEE